MVLALGGAASVAGEAVTGRTFRIVAKDLEDGLTFPQLLGQWRLYSLRFYADEACAPQSVLEASVVGEATVTVSRTYAPLSSPLSRCDGPFGGVVCSRPRDPLSEGASPGLAIRSWVGAPALGFEEDGAWIQLDWATSQTIGCVKLFQDAFQTSASLSLLVAGNDGELIIAATSPGRSCPQDAPTACCVCGVGVTSGCDWDCPAVTTLRTAPHPPPSPPPQPPLAPDDGRSALSSGLDSDSWPLLIIIIVLLGLLLLVLCCCLVYACYRGWIGAGSEEDGRASYGSQLFLARPGKRASNPPATSAGYGADDELRMSAQSGNELFSEAPLLAAPDMPTVDEPQPLVQVREAQVRGGQSIRLVQVRGAAAVGAANPADNGTPVSPGCVLLRVHATDAPSAGTINLGQLADTQTPTGAAAYAGAPPPAGPSPDASPPPAAAPAVSLVVRQASVGGGALINVVERI